MRKGSLKWYAANMLPIAFYGALICSVIALFAAIMVSAGFLVTAGTIIGKIATTIVVACVPVFLVALMIAFTE